MSHEPLVQSEYEALRNEERDRMNGRVQVWTLYLTVVGAFSFVTLQSGTASYVVALCPLVLSCLARHARHSEDVLSQVRKYLYELEERNGYSGYEHFIRSVVRSTYGGHKIALRDAFVLTDLLAMSSVVIHLYQDRVSPLVILLVFLVDVAAIAATWRYLSRSSRGK